MTNGQLTLPGGVSMDHKNAGMIMTAPTVIKESVYRNIFIIFLGILLCVVGYLFICFAVPWISETVCTLFYKTVSWGSLIGFN